MKTTLALLSLLSTLIPTVPALAQLSPTPPSEIKTGQVDFPQKGGRYFTARGEIRALVIFLQFAEDDFQPAHPTWPVDSGPAYRHIVLDSTLAQRSTNGGLTHYFRLMSFDQLLIYGDAHWVTTAHSKQWYVDNGKNFSDINREVLLALDPRINYADYDRWTFGSAFKHRPESDGIVDLLIVIHRERYTGQFGLWNGVSVVFYGREDLRVDEGKTRIKRGFPGSGMTLDSGFRGRRTDWYAHELGHKLLGSGHPRYGNDPAGVKNYAFGGLMTGHGDVVNAHERAYLGWIDLKTVTAARTTFTLRDFATTGDACRIPLPGTADEAFILENHQELVEFDRPNQYGPGKGLYIYHVKGRGPQPRYDVKTADGQFEWSNPYWTQNPWGLRATDSIPVFRQGSPTPRGADALDALPTTKKIYHKNFAEDHLGEAVANRRVFGSPCDPFAVGYNQVFSPWSNPNSHRWDGQTPSGITVELLDQTPVGEGEVFTVAVYRENGEDAAPGNPRLLSAELLKEKDRRNIRLVWAGNREPDIAGYRVYRQSGAAPPLNISGTALLTDTVWVDQNLPDGEHSHTYWITVTDTQQKTSNFSNGILLRLPDGRTRIRSSCPSP